MFEVVEVGPVESKRWWKRQKWRVVKLKVIEKCACEYLKRSFEGYQRYSVQTYRAEFAEGTVISIWMRLSEMIAVGDKMNVETLAGKGYLADFFRLVGTQY